MARYKILQNDARERLVEVYQHTHNAKMLACAYEVSESTVYRLNHQKQTTGSVALRTSMRGRKSKISPEQRELVRKVILKKPDITLKEIIEELGLSCSVPALCKMVRHVLGFTFKKKMIHASEQERPRRAGATGRMETKRTSKRKNRISG